MKLSTDEKKLDSWKEIAAYLGREVRTVQRWEKNEGLPVHRHLHNKVGTVYAFASELDAWLESRRTLIESGTEMSKNAPTTRPGNSQYSSPQLIIAILLVIFTVGVFTTYFIAFYETYPKSSAEQRVKLAVLPFQSLENQPEQDYFSDGMTEEVINQLARLEPEKLGLIGRTSVMRYKSAPKNLAAIGRELDVDYILEGTIRREAQQVRVTAQLIRVKDQTHLWADTFNQESSDILTIQTKIARHIAESLIPKLVTGAFAETNRLMTGNNSAYDAYLKGRYALNRGTLEQLELSIKFFKTASELDPNFALSYTGLAEAYATIGAKGLKPGEECFPKAEEAARKALTLNSNLAEAYSVLATIKFYWNWDLNAAEKEFLRAIDIYPALATAHHGYAHLLSIMGRHDDAIKEAKRAQELEPLSAVISSDAGWFYFRARRYDEAIAECRKVLELEPDFPSAQSCIINCLKLKGLYEEALREERKSLKKNNPEAKVHAIVDANPQQTLQKIVLWRLRQFEQKNSEAPFYRASLYAQLGEIDQAFQWLEIAYQARDQRILQLGVSPVFDVLKNDSRFADLIKRIGLPVQLSRNLS